MDMKIQENDHVIIRKGPNLKVIQVKKNKQVWMEKTSFILNNVIDQPYGSTFEAKGKNLEKVDTRPVTDSVSQDEDRTIDTNVKISADNRSLQDSSDNQKLSKEDIYAMREEGVSGQKLVDKIVENSATFKEKTQFSQQKYISKKKKKHLALFQVLRPTTRLLAEMYYNKGPLKICHLRLDSLSQLLLHANVRAGCKMMVVESCAGLVLGAAMERMGGLGCLIHLYGSFPPVRQAIDAYNFPKDHFEILHSFPLNKINALKHSNESDDPKQSTEDPSIKEIQEDTGDVKCEDITMQQASSDNGQDDQMKNQKNDSGEDSKNQTATSGGEKRKQDFDKEQEKLQRKAIREQQLERTRQMILKKDMDGLIVVSKYHPAPIVMSLIEYVAPSRPVVIFSGSKEPLIDCYTKLRDRGSIVNLRLTETWLREHQVLPSRTHPQINMSSASGYLLFGTTVLRG